MSVGVREIEADAAILEVPLYIIPGTIIIAQETHNRRRDQFNTTAIMLDIPSTGESKGFIG